MKNTGWEADASTVRAYKENGYHPENNPGIWGGVAEAMLFLIGAK
jgi:hypothetical protein